MKKTEGEQVPPIYYGYDGGFSNITICTKCERTALYEDAHVANPCSACGNDVNQYVGKWIAPVYKFLFFKKLSNGYWQLR